MVKISIIIPIYNAGRYLEKCLDSIVEQSFRDIEIICINDGSIDNSLAILKKYSEKDRRIVVVTQENSGSSNARNKALEIARGEYCLNIDSDDWIEQGYLETMYNTAKKNNLDIVISDIIFSYEFTNKILKDVKLEEESYITGYQWIKLFFRYKATGYTWNKLIKREIIKNLRYNENIFYWEDVEFLLKLALNSKKIGKVNKSFYNYRIGENNGSKRRSIKKFLDKEICCLEIEKEFFKNKISKEILDIFYYRRYRELLLELLFTEYSLEEKRYYIEKRDEYLKKIDFIRMRKIEKKYFEIDKRNNKKIIIISSLYRILPKIFYKFIFEIVKKIKIQKLYHKEYL